MKLIGREVVALHTTSSVLGAWLEDMWRFAQRTFYIGPLRVKLVQMGMI